MCEVAANICGCGECDDVTQVSCQHVSMTSQGSFQISIFVSPYESHPVHHSSYLHVVLRCFTSLLLLHIACLRVFWGFYILALLSGLTINASALFCNARHWLAYGNLSSVPDTRFIVYKRGLAGPRLLRFHSQVDFMLLATWYLWMNKYKD